jgi:hypothetical protein
MKNETNNSAKRTAAQVNAILKSNGIDFKAANQGDGNLFCIQDASLKTAILLKKAGFIINERTKNVTYFNCF